MKNAIVLKLINAPRVWQTALLFMMLVYIPMFGQNKMDQHGSAQLESLSDEQTEFNVRLQAFVDSCMKDQKLMDRYSGKRHTCSSHDEVDIAGLAMEEARHQFIIQNLEEYKQLFISAEQSMTIMDICDNGGFEQDFLYYEGFTSTYSFGSDSCSPQTNFGPSVFIPAILPTTSRFEIVTSGVDPLVGINRTKFGDKALRINNRYGHGSDLCFPARGIDKITKTFEVTASNRIFNIWYAVVLENPDNIPHPNSQPFFNMSCDLALADELCFAADFLNCDSIYVDSLCEYWPIDVLDWTCHQFRIDSIYIGDTATLEIFVADCGLGGHFGYAYIDGICEDCTGSALGEIFLESIYYNVDCEGDTASICGSYNPPDICNQNWWLDSIMVDGYTIPGFTIDTTSNTFCIDFPISNFGMDSCLTVIVKGKFTNGSEFTPFQLSNEIEICKDQYSIPSIDIIISGCMDNTPDPGTANNNISDDYYYVNIEIDNHDGLDWIILRTLIDPYPNEQDTRTIAKGTGSAALVLGPFKIQEGGWILTLYVEGGCELIEYVEPPAYCSGCSAFYEVEIGNVQCLDDDEWSFDLYVPSETGTNFTLNSTSYSYNTIHTINVGVIQQGCIEYTLSTGTCVTKFTVCPPKPCSFNCNLEVYVEDVPCSKDEYGMITYYVDLEVKWPPSKYGCFEATKVDGTPLDDGPMPSPQQVGPFTEDIYLTLYVCNSSNCTNCPCYKTIYVPTPDCNHSERIAITGTKEVEFHNRAEVYVQPNPTNSGEIMIYSSLPRTEYEILDVHGRKIISDAFIGAEHRQSLIGPPGIYFLKYRDLNGQGSVLKIIKQ
jgi:hypothetical protein